MKTLTSAAMFAATLAAAPAAAAPAFVAYSEWAVEAETAEFGVGVELAHGALTATPMLIGSYDDTNDFQFSSAELQVNYQITDAISGYAVFETDDDFDYDELTIGAALRF